MKRYQSVEFKKKYSIEILKTFFKDFPEEKRGRKRFKEREIELAIHKVLSDTKYDSKKIFELIKNQNEY